MALILIIGGYGGFGARLARRLAERGHRLLVGGRDGAKAARFCAGLDGAMPVVVDRTGDVAAVLAEQRPDLVIDAAGPFQASDYRVPQACIAAGIAYLDLADARDFVGGIGVLDAAARAAGVAVIAGASSVPALSGAVARMLAEGLDRVVRVDVAITASNRAGAGPSVAKAILSYVGRPVRLWRGRRWTDGVGWQDLRRQRFAVAGAAPLRRWTALADVPDHDLLPVLLPGRPATIFRAGTELAFQNIGLWLLSWPVRWGWIRSLAGAGWLARLQRLTIGLGGDRSAMTVALTGAAGDMWVERRWTLVAERGDGPEIPTLAAVLLAEDIVGGHQAPGARDAAALLVFDRFEALFGSLAIRHETVERALPSPLYARVMGPAFDRLPPAVRAMHLVHGDGGATGEGQVLRGRSWLARAIGWIMRFPPEGVWPLHVAFAENDGVETWARDFGGHRFSSRLGQEGDRLVERFGPLRFRFALAGDDEGLVMRFAGWTCCGVPLPRALAPRIEAREWQEDDRFRLGVWIRMPLVGTVVEYRGWLKGEDDSPPASREGQGEGMSEICAAS